MNLCSSLDGTVLADVISLYQALIGNFEVDFFFFVNLFQIENTETTITPFPLSLPSATSLIYLLFTPFVQFDQDTKITKEW